MARRALHLAQGAAIGLVVLLFVLLVWRLVHNDAGAVAADVRDGQHPTAPDFTAKRIDGRGQISLSSLRGHAVLVNFFNSTCIPACSDETPVLERTWTRYRRAGLVVLGVDWFDFNVDGRHFLERYGATFPAVQDGSGSIGNRYGVTGTPETYVVDRTGKVVDAIIGSINSDADKSRLRLAVERALSA
jgi:peroxiredoxin